MKTISSIIIAGILLVVFLVAPRGDSTRTESSPVPAVAHSKTIREGHRSPARLNRVAACPGCAAGTCGSESRQASKPTQWHTAANNKPATKRPVAGKQAQLGNLTPGEGMAVSLDSLLDLVHSAKGDRVSLPLPGGAELNGTITMADQNPATGWWIRSMALDSHPDGVLVFDRQPNGKLGGHIYSRSSEAAYRVASIDEGVANFAKIPRTDLIPECALATGPAPAKASSTIADTGTPVPSLESLAGSPNVLYIDLDGESVSGTAWNANFNGGAVIDALAPSLDANEMFRAWVAISEDFRPFNTNVTTDRSVYDAADPAKRMMVVFTPTYEWYGSAGGVAYLSSFGNESFRVCWVFTSLVGGVQNKAMAASHEFGHTLSLQHDGDSDAGTNYYGGHGFGTTSWGPIMGAPYGRSLVQWNPGTYPGATTSEDDVALIASYLGIRTDDIANSIGAAQPISTFAPGEISQVGVISTRSDIDVFRIDAATSGWIDLDILPIRPESPSSSGANLDVEARLLNASGQILVIDNPVDGITADIARYVAPGTYYLQVDGIGKSGTDGYSDYGSLGAYNIVGQFPAASTPGPVMAVRGNGLVIPIGDTSPSTADGTEFGTIGVENGPITRSFSIQNTGDQNLVVSEAILTNTAFSLVTSALPWTIAPGSSKSVTIVFDPTSAGLTQATVAFVHSGQNPSPYTFDVSGIGEAAPAGDDDYEPNNGRLSAYDIAARERTWLTQVSGAGVQLDEDWYEIYLTPGYEQLVVDCQFAHAEGDIDIAVYDANGGLLASSTSISDDEAIDFVAPTSGTHYIRVYYGNQGNTYDLWWDDLLNPNPPADDHGNSRANATPMLPMSTVAGELEASGDDDYFRFDLSDPTLVMAATTGATDTYGYLLSETGTLLTNDDGGAGLNFLVVRKVLAPGRYYIRVRGYGSGTVGGYQLVFKTVSLARFGIKSLQKDPSGYMRVEIHTETGRTYGIQKCTDMQSWSTVATGIQGSATRTWTDFAAAAGQTGFYRVIVE